MPELSNIEQVLNQLAQHIVEYIIENNVIILAEDGFKEILIDFLEFEHSDLPDHENPMDFLNETIDNLLGD